MRSLAVGRFGAVPLKSPAIRLNGYIAQELFDMPLGNESDVVRPVMLLAIPQNTSEITSIILDSLWAFAFGLLG